MGEDGPFDERRGFDVNGAAELAVEFGEPLGWGNFASSHVMSKISANIESRVVW